MLGKPDISLSYDIDLITIDNLPCNDINIVLDILSSITVQNIDIEIISQTPAHKGSISLTLGIPSQALVGALSALNKFKYDYPNLLLSIDSDNARVSAYVEEELSSISVKLYRALLAQGIEVKFISASDLAVSFLIYKMDADKALYVIKNELH